MFVKTLINSDARSTPLRALLLGSNVPSSPERSTVVGEARECVRASGESRRHRNALRRELAGDASRKDHLASLRLAVEKREPHDVRGADTRHNLLDVVRPRSLLRSLDGRDGRITDKGFGEEDFAEGRPPVGG